MSWFNCIGLIIVVLMLVPNIVYAAKCKEGFINLYKNKFVEIMEQVGRFPCFLLMVFNIPYLYLNFWFDNALLVYIVINSSLLLIYLLGWIFCWKRHQLLKAYLLSIVPSIIFIFSGIVLLNIPLIVFATIFAVFHITLSLKNAYMQIEAEQRR